MGGEGKRGRKRGVKKHKLKIKATKVPLTKAEEKIKEKLAEIEPDCKVWVGGLKAETTWKTLEKHFATVAKPKVTSMLRKKGTACVAYESADDVLNAIATLNGSELQGKTLEVDSWVKPERREKKPKDE